MARKSKETMLVEKNKQEQHRFARTGHRTLYCAVRIGGGGDVGGVARDRPE